MTQLHRLACEQLLGDESGLLALLSGLCETWTGETAQQSQNNRLSPLSLLWGLGGKV